jgi:glycosyltransferase involved in cell wall biosynthesis
MADAKLRRPLAVVVPAYQVASSVSTVVSGIRRALPGAAIIVVDDGSTDGTAAAAATGVGAATVLVHDRNQGKGAALIEGIGRAVADGAEIVATMDADGQHAPEWLPRLVAPLQSQEADLVLGARARGGTMPLARRATNWLSARVASRVAGSRIPDAQTGYRAFTRKVAVALQPCLESYRGYDYEAVFLLAALRAGYRVVSIEVPTIYASAPSHFRQWGDGWKVARVFARYFRGAA